MVLYESHSVIHGRPFPLRGKFYANVFVHFEPVGPLDPEAEPERAIDSSSLDLPPYLIPDSPWEKQWISQNPTGWKGVRRRRLRAKKMSQRETHPPSSL
jgi:prolyl 4-hydroxylase